MKTLNDYLKTYPQLSTVVAVSKTQSVEAIHQLHQLGFNDFGENKVQELKAKAMRCPEYHWHFIGHIQSNKIKEMVQYAQTIHSIESIKQIELIEKEAAKHNKFLDVLIQVNLTHEVQKSGCHEENLDELCEAVNDCLHLSLKGLMVMGPSNGNPSETEYTFKKAQQLLKAIQIKHPECVELSMGMSQDYLIALKYGSSILRLGTLLFGKRFIEPKNQCLADVIT
jgi:pyridoxal phosphate enzyme (YggS family)